MRYAFNYDGPLWEVQKALLPLIGNSPVDVIDGDMPAVSRLSVSTRRKRKTSYRGKNLAPDGHSAPSFMVHLLQQNGGKMHLDRVKKRLSEFYASNSWSGPLSILRIEGVIGCDKDGILNLLRENLTQEEVKEIVREHNRRVKFG